jgi:type II secretory pathway component PulF
MIISLDEFLFTIKLFFTKIIIKNSSSKRIQIYRDLESHLSSTDVDDALTSLQYEAEALNNNEIIMYEEIQLQLQQQGSFYEAISQWVPLNEALQIKVSKQSKDNNSLPSSIKLARNICEQKKKLSSMYVSKVTYPAVMFFSAITLIVLFKDKIFSFLTSLKPFNKWEVQTQQDYIAISFYVDNVIIITSCLLILVFIIVRFMTHGKGKIRSSVNKIPPFSIYQSITSYTVLMSLSSLTKSGVQLSDALKLIATSLNGWAKHELTEIVTRLEKPDELPEDTPLLQYAFNSPIFTKLVRVKVSSYAKRKGFIENLNFLNSVLIEDVSKETFRSSAVLGALLLFSVLGVVAKFAIIFMSVMLAK